MTAEPTTADVREMPPARPRRSWRQFSLRTLLLAMVTLATLLGVFAMRLERARKQAAAVVAIQRLGGTITYDFECKPASRYGLEFVTGSKSPVPTWLIDRLGLDFFHSVVNVDLNQRFLGDEDIKKLPDFPNLLGLNLRRSQMGNSGAAAIAHYQSLKSLNLVMSEIGDTGLKEIATLKSLQVLNLDQTRLSDSGLAHIAKLRDLRELTISNNPISDDGSEVWLRLPSSKSLISNKRQ